MPLGFLKLLSKHVVPTFPVLKSSGVSILTITVSKGPLSTAVHTCGCLDPHGTELLVAYLTAKVPWIHKTCCSPTSLREGWGRESSLGDLLRLAP